MIMLFALLCIYSKFTQLRQFGIPAFEQNYLSNTWKSETIQRGDNFRLFKIMPRRKIKVSEEKIGSVVLPETQVFFV